MMEHKRIKLVMGYSQSSSEDDDTSKNTRKMSKTGVFVPKREVVIYEKDLAAFFRRESEYCSMVIKIENTTDPLSKGYQFSERSTFKL